jgi:hypothetical protein
MRGGESQAGFMAIFPFRNNHERLTDDDCRIPYAGILMNIKNRAK